MHKGTAYIVVGTIEGLHIRWHDVGLRSEEKRGQRTAHVADGMRRMAIR